MSDFDFEPVRGLPQLLPKGERMIWQGVPTFRALAIRTFKIRVVAIYFAALMAWRFVASLSDGATIGQTLSSVTWLAALGAVAAGTLALLAWAAARSTVYTITSQRVVMRFGMALPLTINLPFSQIARAALRADPDGTGDIPLELARGQKVAYLVLWPHARPGYLAAPEPMLRGIPDASRVAKLLAEAMQAAEQLKAAAPALTVPVAANDAGRPATARPAAVVAAE